MVNGDLMRCGWVFAKWADGASLACQDEFGRCGGRQREERFLSAQADRFAGAKREEKVGLLRSK